MSQSKQFSVWGVGKIVGITALSLALNYLIRNGLKVKENSPQKRSTKEILLDVDDIPQLKTLKSLKSMQNLVEEEVCEQWGNLKLKNFDPKDALLAELSMMNQVICAFQKVHNLIVDLELQQVQTFPCPLIATETKRIKGQPSLHPDSLVQPGQFVIQNCAFRSGMSVENEKKFMRAGPRATQFFNSHKVRADIVCLGKVAPGINNIIRELVILLSDVYKVQKVHGVKFSYKGYYQKSFIDLTPATVETIHHYGGSFLGVAKTQFHPKRIIDSLEEREVNQLYLIGGNDTLISAYELYREIKKRNLQIAICVCLKAINKDIVVFDTCFGFQSAVEEVQHSIDQAYALSKSNFNSVVMIKVPGRYSGFLAMDSCKAARNANICLVPQFQYDLYGEKGLLKFIADKIKFKGHCILVYSEGASYAVRDIEKNLYKQMLKRKQGKQSYSFDVFLKHEIQIQLTTRKILPNNVFLFDTQDTARTVPANAFDTKLCCQIALASIQGLMCGYTCFAIGHVRNRVAMAPIKEMVQREDKFCLREEDEEWQRLRGTTGQPRFQNEQILIHSPSP